MTRGTKNKRSILKKYLQDVAQALHLYGWEFEVVPKDSEDRCVGSVEHFEGRLIGLLSVGDNFWEATEREQRLTVIHEILHLHFSRDTLFLEREVLPLLSPALEDAHKKTHDLNVEYAFEHLAAALAPHVPLAPAALRESGEAPGGG